MPYRTEDFISEKNCSKTFEEECHLRDLITTGEDAEFVLTHARARNFDHKDIQRLVRKLILEEVYDEQFMKNLLQQSNIEVWDDLEYTQGMSLLCHK